LFDPKPFDKFSCLIDAVSNFMCLRDRLLVSRIRRMNQETIVSLRVDSESAGILTQNPSSAYLETSTKSGLYHVINLRWRQSFISSAEVLSACNIVCDERTPFDVCKKTAPGVSRGHIRVIGAKRTRWFRGWLDYLGPVVP